MLAGVVDPDYTGNVGIVLYNLSSDTKFTRLVGQPIVQLILEVASIFPTLEVGGLPTTARGYRKAVNLVIMTKETHMRKAAF